MIGKLKKVSFRERYGQQVARFAVDIPMGEVEGREIEEEELQEWLQHRVGKHVGFDFTTLEDQDQDVIEVGLDQ